MPLTRTDTGLVIQTRDEIVAELAAAVTSPSGGISTDLDTSPDSTMGRLLTIMADREESIHLQVSAVLQDSGVYASGTALTDVCLLTGTVRDQGTPSTVTLQCVITGPLPAGARVSDATGAVVFETLADLATSGPVQARCLSVGPTVAPAHTLTRKVSVPSPGSLSAWTSVDNATAAVTGTARRTRSSGSVSRAVELVGASVSTPDSLRAAVSRLPGVVGVSIINDTALHHFELVVYGLTAVNDAIAQAIWSKAPAGISSVSTGGTAASGTAVDAVGTGHTVTFSRAVETPIYVDVSVTRGPGYPVDGETRVRAAITSVIESGAGIGSPVETSRMYGPLHAIPGVEGVNYIRVGTAPNPTDTRVVLGAHSVPIAGTISVSVV